MKTNFQCNNCQNISPKWLGKCPSCEQWNTLEEIVVEKKSKRSQKEEVWKDEKTKISKAKRLDTVIFEKLNRIDCNDQELNRVLGGGLVKGSLILIGGEPGIGKSTLLLQLALHLQEKICYISGEESESQIKMRADRIHPGTQNCFVYAETNLSKILKEVKDIEPDILIIDSIQTVATPFVESTPGSITQVRECTSELQRFAKERNIVVFVIGHITKEGSIAGPKILEHIVDVVLQFEGDKNYSYRILRSLKNRFGSTDELGIYEMNGQGLKAITNPSDLLLSQSDESLSGSAVAATINGARPMLVETQALVSTAVYGNPQRSSTGFDLRRMNMLLAVLEKRAGLQFGQQDVFLNIAGGIKMVDPSLDLAVTAALVGSLNDITISPKFAFAAELGLTGEIRAVHRIEQRVLEADRLGFEKLFISKYNLKNLETSKYNIELVGLSKIEDLIYRLFT